jgi:exo-beta-1,3-glucanase (GH17 family)
MGQPEIQEDMKFLSKYTKSIRTYAMHCDQDIALLKEAARNGIEVIFGFWIGPEEWNLLPAQLSLLENVLKNTTKEEQKFIKSIVVGNEDIFRGEQTSKSIAAKINVTREFLKKYGLDHVKLTHAGINRDYDSILIEAVDYLLPNLHIFFDGYEVSEAPGNFFYKYEQLVKLTDKQVIVGEVGWPSGGDPWSFDGGKTISKSKPGVENAKFILNSLLCEANRLKLPYYYFDAFNADWKPSDSANSEFHWGIATSDRKAKGYLEESILCTENSYSFSRVETCSGKVFDNTIYSCTNNVWLCPKPSIGCGLSPTDFACIDPAKYTCKNGVPELNK